MPKSPSPDTEALARIVEVREDGRRFIINRKEGLLTNWFPINPPEHIRYYGFEGLQEQTKAWLRDCKIPHVPTGRLVGSFADPPAFAMSSSFDLETPTEYEASFVHFISGKNLGPYYEKGLANNDIVNCCANISINLRRSADCCALNLPTKKLVGFSLTGCCPATRLFSERRTVVASAAS